MALHVFYEIMHGHPTCTRACTRVCPKRKNLTCNKITAALRCNAWQSIADDNWPDRHVPGCDLHSFRVSCRTMDSNTIMGGVPLFKVIFFFTISALCIFEYNSYMVSAQSKSMLAIYLLLKSLCFFVWFFLLSFHVSEWIWLLCNMRIA